MARTHVILDDEVLKAIDGKVLQRGRSRFAGEARAHETRGRHPHGRRHPERRGLPHWRDTESVEDWLRGSRRGDLTADDLPAR